MPGQELRHPLHQVEATPEAGRPAAARLPGPAPPVLPGGAYRGQGACRQLDRGGRPRARESLRKNYPSTHARTQQSRPYEDRQRRKGRRGRRRRGRQSPTISSQNLSRGSSGSTPLTPEWPNFRSTGTRSPHSRPTSPPGSSLPGRGTSESNPISIPAGRDRHGGGHCRN